MVSSRRNTKALTLEIVKDRVYKVNPNIIVLTEKYNPYEKLMVKCILDGNIWNTTLSHIERNQGCQVCRKNNKVIVEKSTNELKERLNHINQNIQIIDDIYTNLSKNKLSLRCLIDGHEWTASWSNLSTGYGCPICSGNKVSEKNRLSSIHPELIKYFKNKEDAENYSFKSSVIVSLKCPHCYYEKMSTVANLSSYGFKCNICGDGFSIPNKFTANILKNINIEFIPEKSFIWSKNKRYDFYIPEKNMIIEVHGGQHYEYSGRGRDLKEEQENDILKEMLAKANGIENYIVIDCRLNNFDFISNSIKKSLKVFFDLDNLNLYEIFESCMSSKMVESWRLYNCGKSIHEIRKELFISETTYYNYMKVGVSLNKCNYKPRRK